MILDIDYKQVPEWLYERKKLPKDWANRLKGLTLKAEKLFQESEFPTTEIKDFVATNRENTHYHIIDSVVNMLLKTDAAKEKNFLGRYTSKTINEWIALKKLYEKDNLHCADMGKVLAQNVNYEIPAAKKNVKELEQQITECQNKELDYKATIKHLEQEFRSHCEKLGITGEDISNEIPGMLTKIPALLTQVTESIKDPLFREALDYYYEFSVHANPSLKKEDVVLKYAEYINREGDHLVDVFELKNAGKEVPADLVKKNASKYKKFAKFGKKNVQQNFDKIIELDFTVEASGNENPSGGIDWSGFEILGGTNNNSEAKPEEAKKQNENNEFVVIDNEDEVIPEGDTILSNVDSRNQLLADLNELLFFIRQRILESKGVSGNVVLQAYEESDQGLDLAPEKLQSIVNVINKCIEPLIDSRACQLFILKDQPKAQERLINHLNDYRSAQKRPRDLIVSTEKKGYEVEKLLAESKKSIQAISKETIELKKLLESSIKNVVSREIHLIGDVNKIKV